jgi:hypothetical protein
MEACSYRYALLEFRYRGVILMAASQRADRRCVVTVALAALTLAGVAAPANAAAVMTLSAAGGPSGGGNTIIGTIPAGTGAFPAGTTPTVQFQYIGTGASACANRVKNVAQIEVTGLNATDGVLTAAMPR